MASPEHTKSLLKFIVYDDIQFSGLTLSAKLVSKRPHSIVNNYLLLFFKTIFLKEISVAALERLVHSRKRILIILSLNADASLRLGFNCTLT